MNINELEDLVMQNNHLDYNSMVLMLVDLLSDTTNYDDLIAARYEAQVLIEELADQGFPIKRAERCIDRRLEETMMW